MKGTRQGPFASSQGKPAYPSSRCLIYFTRE